jgi:hypothetical protein
LFGKIGARGSDRLCREHFAIVGDPVTKRERCEAGGLGEQFSTPEPNVTVSTAGFSVEFLGRTGIRYTDGERSMFIDSEVLAIPRTVAVFEPSIKAWNPPHRDEPVTALDRAHIIDNLRKALASRGSHLQL